ncbi:PLAT/LH2 domain-containing protein [Streptomyces albipurpureus]|uniref:PLAT domain-containing protein n=1 Tax=Streptomyces albipurpureus TaxID=2897419 RepID=A0ABT0UFV0_9ACTN|nr:PLAT/LH2 domain-containing protein [Streptomyces sp. CWNU-1]MCM2387499.1 hypothetical protein [Streptomyces sp. CWNU-1]
MIRRLPGPGTGFVSRARAVTVVLLLALLAVPGVLARPASAAADVYRLTLYTTSQALAATDGDVHARLFTEGGTQGEWVLLDSPGNDFERGQTATYEVTFPQGVGRPNRLELYLDSTDYWIFQVPRIEAPDGRFINYPLPVESAIGRNIPTRDCISGDCPTYYRDEVSSIRTLAPWHRPGPDAQTSCTVNGTAKAPLLGTISGTPGADSIECVPGTGNIMVDGLGGDDTISFTGDEERAAVLARGGPGDDTISFTGDEERAAVLARGGPGDDTITITDADVSRVEAGAGDDIVTVTRGAVVSGLGLYGGLGADRITVTGQHAGPAVVNGTVSGGELLVGGLLDGDDIITLTGGTSDSHTARTYAVGGRSTVDGDAGDDRIRVQGGNINEPGEANGGQALSRNGQDSPFVEGGPGRDTIEVFGGLSSDGIEQVPTSVQSLVQGGAGADSVTIGSGLAAQNPRITDGIITGDDDSLLALGAGNDTITVNAVYSRALISGAPGNDILKLTGTNAGAMDGGLGTDTCSVGSGTPPDNCEN